MTTPPAPAKGLLDLAARCETAERWDHTGLDADIMEALGAEVNRAHGRIGTAYRNVPWKNRDTSRWQSMPKPSKSLDAALALMAEKLPGWGATITMALGGSGHATVFNATGLEIDQNGLTKRDGLSDWIDHHKNAATLALALMAALLRALAQQEQTDPG